MKVRLAAMGNRFYAPCVLRGRADLRLFALLDTGSSVTAVRGDICRRVGLTYTGELPTSCVHGSHASVLTRTYSGSIIIGERIEHVAIYEMGRTLDHGVPIDAILGLDVLEACRAGLDWPRMRGSLEAQG